MRVPFPTLGLVEGGVSAEQPIRTSFLIRNCRAFDVAEERLTGGQRSGVTKAYSTQCSLVGVTTHPIVAFAQVTSTFIPAVAP